MNPDTMSYLNSLSEDELWTLYENLDSLDYKTDDQIELLYHIEVFFEEEGEAAQNEQEREEFFADWAEELNENAQVMLEWDNFCKLIEEQERNGVQ